MLAEINQFLLYQIHEEAASMAANGSADRLMHADLNGSHLAISDGIISSASIPFIGRVRQVPATFASGRLEFKKGEEAMMLVETAADALKLETRDIVLALAHNMVVVYHHGKR